MISGLESMKFLVWFYIRSELKEMSRDVDFTASNKEKMGKILRPAVSRQTGRPERQSSVPHADSKEKANGIKAKMGLP